MLIGVDVTDVRRSEDDDPAGGALLAIGQEWSNFAADRETGAAGGWRGSARGRGSGWRGYRGGGGMTGRGRSGGWRGGDRRSMSSF